MKKITLTLVAAFFAITSFAGNDIKVYFCDNTVETIDEQQLLLCNELVLNSNEWKIKSLTIGFKSGKDYVTTNLEGNKMTEILMERIKKVSPEKIYIENILLVNSKGEETKLENQVISITE